MSKDCPDNNTKSCFNLTEVIIPDARTALNFPGMVKWIRDMINTVYPDND